MWGIGNIFLWRPSDQQITAVLTDADRRGFNYSLVRGSQHAPGELHLDRGWAIDHVKVKLGSGKATYDRAVHAVLHWQQFDLPWARVHTPVPAKLHALVAVVAHTLVAWTCNPLKIVYVEHTTNAPVHRYACRKDGRVSSPQPLRTTRGRQCTVAHGTLEGHQLRGEERFAVEWHKDDDSVWYEINTFSQPATPLAVVTYALVRHFQCQFARDSVARMQQLVTTPPTP